MAFPNKLVEKASNFVKWLWKKTFGKLMPEKPEEEEIPAAWRKEIPPGSQAPGQAEEGSRVLLPKRKYRVKWLHQAKRLIAAVLLLINFVISQFVLGTFQSGGWALFAFFMGNSFILLDYLWKTRAKKD